MVRSCSYQEFQVNKLDSKNVIFGFIALEEDTSFSGGCGTLFFISAEFNATFISNVYIYIYNGYIWHDILY